MVTNWCSVMILLLTLTAPPTVAQEPLPVTTPLLPLPDPSQDEVAIDNWSGVRTLSNSGRAWHYHPPMVQPLHDLLDSLYETSLSYSTMLMLATVVASRNECRY